MNLPLPFLLAISLAGGVWLLVLALRMPTLHGCLALLLAVACFGPAFAKWELGPISGSSDRFIFMVLVAIAALKRFMTCQPALTLDRLDLILAAQIALLGFSIVANPPPPRLSPTAPTPTYLFLAGYLCPVVLFWITRYRAVDQRDIRWVVTFVVIFGLYLSATAVFEAHSLTAFIFPRYILQTRLHYEGRSVGPFLSAPALGTWLTVASVGLVILWFRGKGLAKLAVTGLLPLFAYAEYLTETRSAWMGYVVSVPLAAVLLARNASRHALIVLIVIVGLIGGLFLGERFLMPERKEGRGVVAHSMEQRLALLQRSVAMFVQRPLFGWGFGQFEYAARVHGGGGPIEIVSPDDDEALASHNVFLRFLAELGLVGLSLQLLVFGNWILLARNQLRSTDYTSPERCFGVLFVGALCAYVAEAMFHDVTFIAQDTMLVFFLAGCMGPLSRGQVTGDRVQGRSNQDFGRAVGAIGGIGVRARFAGF